MLKNINHLLSPDLLKILMEMGHGDEIVIADGNYPSASNAARLVRLDGLGGVDVLEAILSVLPLDMDSTNPVTMMNVKSGDPQPEIWEEYQRILEESKEKNISIEYLDRFDFYEKGRKAYAIVATGETATYANLILRKGVI